MLSVPLSLPLNLVLFALATGLVWYAGTRMVVLGDELAERLGWTREFIGLVFLATATELPEIVTTITAAQAGNADLVLGNMFGGVTMQTAILAVADILFVRYALTSWPRKPTHALEAVFLVIFLNVLLLVSFLGEVEVVWAVGLGSLALFVAYPMVIGFLRQYDARGSWAPIDMPGDGESPVAILGGGDLQSKTTGNLLVQAGVAAFLILIAGYLVANRAEVIAEQTGYGASFIGIALLAAATSMPELSTTFKAARMGAYTMAISNIFGSNLIMLALILPADIVYREGPILAEVNPVAELSIVTGILVTTIYVAGLLIRRTPRVFGAGLDSYLVLAVYFGGLWAAFSMI